MQDNFSMKRRGNKIVNYSYLNTRKFVKNTCYETKMCRHGLMWNYVNIAVVGGSFENSN